MNTMIVVDTVAIWFLILLGVACLVASGFWLYARKKKREG